MISNYFKTALRNLLRRKWYALLNIFGLALGMTGCLLILQYVSYERSYDDFHENSDHIWRLRLDAWQDGRLAWQSATVYPAFGPTMKREFPEVENSCRLHDANFIAHNPETNVRYAEKQGYFADASVLDMFTLTFVHGDRNTALEGPDKILLSETTAKKYFGHTNVVGQTLVLKNTDLFQTYEVTGVFKDLPANSHLVINYLVSFPTLQKIINTTWGDTTNATENSWGWYDFYTYLQLQPETDIEAFRAKFPAFADKYPNKTRIERKLNSRNDIDIIPMQDIHLYSNVNQEAEVNGNGKAVSVLSLVALLILGIAWMNYVNLSTARSVERGREVGVRKVLGARRIQLVRQFLVESLMLNTTAFVVALALASVLMPVFNDIAGKEIPFAFLEQSAFWVVAIGILAGGSMLSGMYPAFILSAFRPVATLKGSLKNTSSGVLLRKALTISQFAMSIALIAATIIVYRQISFMRNQDLGVDIQKTLVVEGAQTVLDSLYMGSFEPFKNQVLALPGIRQITASSSVPGDEIYWTNGYRVLERGDQASGNTMFNVGIDEHFMTAYDLPLVAGRAFSREYGDDMEHRTLILNETAVRTLGFQDNHSAIGKKVTRGDTLTIVGVTRDFHHLGLQKAINPIAFHFYPESRSYYSFKIRTDDSRALIAGLENLWTQHFPGDPFSYFFLDEFYQKQYQSDIRFGQVFTIFSVMAILIACLGLLGLASYQIIQRTKEIGIRKVLGATTTGLVGLLSKDFLRLVGFAFLIAIPVAYYAMSRWLDAFAYRIDIPWSAFIAAGVIAFGVAFLTVGVQSIKAALENPGESLKSE